MNLEGFCTSLVLRMQAGTPIDWKNLGDLMLGYGLLSERPATAEELKSIKRPAGQEGREFEVFLRETSPDMSKIIAESGMQIQKTSLAAIPSRVDDACDISGLPSK